MNRPGFRVRAARGCGRATGGDELPRLSSGAARSARPPMMLRGVHKSRSKRGGESAQGEILWGGVRLPAGRAPPERSMFYRGCKSGQKPILRLRGLSIRMRESSTPTLIASIPISSSATQGPIASARSPRSSVRTSARLYRLRSLLRRSGRFYTPPGRISTGRNCLCTHRAVACRVVRTGARPVYTNAGATFTDVRPRLLPKADEFQYDDDDYNNADDVKDVVVHEFVGS